MKRHCFGRIALATALIVTAEGAASFSFHGSAVAVAFAAPCATSVLPGCNGIDGTKSSASFDVKAMHDGSGFVAGKGKLKLKVTGLLGASLSALGAPGGSATTDAAMTDDLHVCVYDAGVLALDIPIDASAPTWKCSRDSKCTFKGSEASGLTGVLLKADTKPGDGKETSSISLSLSSKSTPSGSSVIESQNPWGVGASPDIFDGASTDIDIQIVNDSSGACWSLDVGGNGGGVDSSKTVNKPVSSGKPHFKASAKLAEGDCAHPEDPQCLECMDVQYCTSDVTCVDGSTSRCDSCETGHYLDSSARPSGADTCPTCSDISDCISPVTCTDATDSQCTQCSSGRYVNQGLEDQCSACSPITGCQSTLTCTTASNTQCTNCDAGRYLQDNAGTADSCPSCSSVAHCTGTVTCTTAADSSCPQCQSGYYANDSGSATVCAQCTDVTNCVTQESCTSDSDSRCDVCSSGYYRQDTGPRDECTACTAIDHCATPSTVTCTTESDSYCPSCDTGYYQEPQTNGGTLCQPCSPISHCVAPDGCTTASTSQCSTCASGFYLQDGTADSCPACTSIPGCQSSITCADAATSQCTSCQSGRYLQQGTSDSCPTCTPIPGCMGVVTCTNASNSVCN